MLLPDLQSSAWVSSLLVGARIAGVVAFMPGIGSGQVPGPIRAGLVFGICVVVAPAIAAQAPATPQPTMPLGLALLSEIAFGAILGFGASLLLEAARLAGELIDLQIGLRAAELFDPIGATRSSLLGTFYYMVAVLLFLQLDGHHWVLAGLYRSFQVAPPGCLVLKTALTPLMLSACTTMLDLALRIGAPVIGTLLLTDIAFGLIVRAVPQVNILFVGMPAKIGLGFATLAVSAPVLIAVLTSLLGDLQSLIAQMIRLVA